MNILNELNRIVNTIKSGKTAEITDKELNEILNHFCEGPIFERERGITHPYTEPLDAEVLNQEYRRRTGTDHKNYISHQLEVIDGLLEDKDILLKAKVYYTEDYFKELEKIKSRIEQEGLVKADKLGNPVPADIQKRTDIISHTFIAKKSRKDFSKEIGNDVKEN